MLPASAAGVCVCVCVRERERERERETASVYPSVFKKFRLQHFFPPHIHYVSLLSETALEKRALSDGVID